MKNSKKPEAVENLKTSGEIIAKKSINKKL